jgi:hypothetical protein
MSTEKGRWGFERKMLAALFLGSPQSSLLEWRRESE